MRDTPVFQLHGGLDADQQDAALLPADRTRVILATNLAETTVTVPDVTCVIDTGLHKVARYDADRAIDSLETERVSQDSADQRAGRAGRVQAGRVLRLWDARDRLRPHREAEIFRVDLASTVLDVLSWGGDPRTLDWFEAPPAGALDAAFALLTKLDAHRCARKTDDDGPIASPAAAASRLGRMLLAARADATMARACALLSERHLVPPRHGATTCDLLAAVDSDAALPSHVKRTAAEIRRVALAEVEGRELMRATTAGE